MSRRGFPSTGPARRLLLVALLPAVLAGCTAGPSIRPPVVENDGPAPGPPSQANSAPQVPLPPLTEPQGASVPWSDCDEETRQRLEAPAVPDTLRFACARLSTTLDAPELPQRGMTRIAVLKVGTGPIPLVVVNDVDGEPGTLFTARLAAVLPAELLQRFSLIGVDRRGTGQSEAARCIPQNIRAQLLDQDPATGNYDQTLDAAREAGQQCAIELDKEQVALDSWRSAGDLDEIRQQLGLGKLNALARGEGSRVLADYAVRFTGQVGRFVLDGAPDPSGDTAAVLDGVAAGLQSTLDAFAADCAARGCPLAPDAKAALVAMVERLRTGRLSTAEDGSFGPGLGLRAVAAGLAQRSRWPELAEAIAAAGQGDVSKLATFTAPLLQDSRLRPSRLDGAMATRCNDTATRLPVNQITDTGRKLQGKYPQFGGMVAEQLAWCGPWPVRREPLPAAGAPGAPPILVTSTAADPVTPESGTGKAADQMPSAVRVGWQGAGHGAVGSSPCATEAVRAFLVEGTVPHDGTLCPA